MDITNTLISAGTSRRAEAAGSTLASVDQGGAAAIKGSPELREAFDDFVGQTLFGSMLAEMRKGLDGPAYMGGGRTEEVFQGQLDQLLVERMADASAKTISGPMYDLFMMGRG